MGHLDHRYSADRRWRLLLAIVCVFLVVVAGTVEIAHTHADRTNTHSDCSLCAAAHVRVHLAETPAPAPPVDVAAVLETLPPSVVPTGLSTFALFPRPPPVATVPA